MTKPVTRMPGHGESRHYKAGCHCDACTNASRKADGRRLLLKATGRWQPFTDPAAARAHLAVLRKSGLTLKDLVRVTGTPQSTIEHIARGDFLQVRTETARRILAVDPRRVAANRYLIDATGTRRRLQAWYWRGLTTQAICGITGLDPRNVRAITRGAVTRVTPTTRDQVARAYRRSFDRDPAEFGVTAQESARARAFARRRGFAPPGAWADIDDPAAQPETAQLEPGAERAPRPLVIAEEVDFVRRTSGVEDCQVIADRLGLTVPTLKRNLERAKALTRAQQRRERERAAALAA